MKYFFHQYGLLSLLLLILCLAYQFQDILFIQPQSIHQWRQADCLSLASNFQENFNLFEPSIHNYISDDSTSGKSAGEFPLLYYIVGQLWNVFGEHIFIYRLFVLLIFLSGLVALFDTCKILFRNDLFWAYFVVILTFTSPVLIYYSNNFLTNVPAFSLVLWAWNYTIKAYKNKNQRYFFYAILFFSFAALFKMTAYISFIVLFCLFILEWSGISLKKNTAFFDNKKKIFIQFLFSFFLVSTYYYWAEYYNGVHGGKYTFNWLWPIWEMSKNEIEEAFHSARNVIYHQAFNRYTFFLIWGSLLFLIIDLKNNIRFLNLFIVITLLGVLLYIILWFNALNGHDYYVINLLILPLAILIFIIINFKQNRPQILNSKRIKWLASLFLVFNIVYAANNIHYRYAGILGRNSFLGKLFMNEFERGLLNYFGHTNPYENLPEMVKYNRSLGIIENDLIIYMPDESINISLYLLKQKGWTSYGGTGSYEEIFDKVKNKNAKYLFIGDDKTLEIDYILPFLREKIGEFKGVKIYDLTSIKE